MVSLSWYCKDINHWWWPPVLLWSHVSTNICLDLSLYIVRLVAMCPTSFFYGTWRFITRFKSDCHLSLSWATSVQSMPPSYFLQIYFHIILPSLLRSSKWSHSLRSPHHIPVCMSPLPHMCNIPWKSHSSLFDHLNSICSGVQVIKVLIIQSLLFLCNFSFHRPRYLPQHTVLKDPQPMFLP